MVKAVFELEGVNFSYLGKFPALCGVDLAIAEGQKISVIGANGSGKSTLLSLLDGLIFPDSGIVKFRGRELRESDFNKEGFSREFRRSVGLVFQNPDIQLFCPTVREDICFGPLQLGVEKSEVKRRLEKICSFLSIGDLLERSPYQLSVGEKRKVAIASTLAIEPEVLILDEPTAGLDPFTTRHIIDILLEENSRGRTIITSTHDLHIVEEISDMVHVFGPRKKIIRSGIARDLLEDENFLRQNNLIHIHKHAHRDKVHIHAHRHLEHHHD